MAKKQWKMEIKRNLEKQITLLKFLLTKCSDEEKEVIQMLIESSSDIMRMMEEDEVIEVSPKELEVIILDYFCELGIPKNIKGYQYLKEAVKLGLNDHSILEQITKRLYPDIAREFETTSSRVERAIRHAIELAWQRGNMEICQKIFGYTVSSVSGKPKNSEFIATMVEYILVNDLS